jgi:hypothetical protein
LPLGCCRGKHPAQLGRYLPDEGRFTSRSYLNRYLTAHALIRPLLRWLPCAGHLLLDR